ncbi:MAG: hypothetical protein CL944_00375 [Candidatus Diapherotrites archaeon]|uniref:Uncharacterized protein n=1 Tax=Candidatus Iainarchaeum sp. TaxID=3101447 RepID=A0A2D6LNZ6_9ARCH|nr:hypothetical protein [Candidatus Diapherotrites archaeon]|tara:strand:- start:13955 stop:14137 length:183 start_codon:yes stop_codon:yes gene_type:complete
MQQTLFSNRNQTLLEIKHEQIKQGISDEEFEHLLDGFCEKYSVEKKALLEAIRKRFSQTR